ncbi:MAG: T9SS type A sorting domain-containing protein [Sphingobacteriales bacterium]|nr:MAG: T9SS type A sorting domain-containing protein [Sphingobacteriales bacterium]
MNKFFYHYRNVLNRALALSLPAILAFNSTQAQCVAPSVGCAGNDRSNSFRNATTPSTIEYDNVVSLFHSTLVRQADGRMLVWGDKTSRTGTNVLAPQEVNTTNYPGLSGEILKFAGGSEINLNSHHFVLTTNGLYFWGTDHWGIGTGTSFQKLTIDGQTNGLPAGVSPGDVKMLFGTNRMLGLVTCSGAAYTLVAATNTNTASAYGNGLAYSTANNSVWHRVMTDATNTLDNVVALRGNGRMNFVALTSAGTLYTWGQSTYLGNNNTYAVRNYATGMTLPSGIVPKMIGMTAGDAINTSTYYVLTTNGSVYALGYNGERQLGDFTTTTSNEWVQVKKSSAANDYLENVVWISPNEHDQGYTNTGSVSVLTADAKLYAWGGNNRTMLGGSTSNASINPTTNLGGLTNTDSIIAVETGGHTSIIVKKCSNFFGYVGHKTGGSMGDGTSTDADIPNYSFSTSQLDICGASTAAATLFPVSGATVGNTYNMNAAPAGGTFSVLSGPATINASTGAITINGAGTVQVRYEVTSGDCPSSTEVSFIASVPTPVTLESFTVSRARNGIVLDWVINKEINNKGFEIQKSSDAENWHTIGFVKSQSENGNNIGRLYYSYTDEQPFTGKNYYRLKQVDRDGSSDYSPVRLITYGEKGQINLFPNPVKENLYIDGLDKNDIVKIYDPSGRVVFEYIAMLYAAEISMNNLPKGIYYLEISSDGKTKLKSKIVKE